MRTIVAAIATVLLGFTSFAYGQTTDDEWRFSFTPYLWLATIKGTTSADGVEPPPINPEYNFFSLENLGGFAFIDFMVGKGQWSVRTDAVYINFADNFDVGPINTNIDLRGGTLELSAGYQPRSWPHTKVIFGVRGVKLDTEIVLTPGPTGSESESWVDPIVGLHYEQQFGKHWGMFLRGDIGGFGVSSDFTANAGFGGSYRFNDLFTMMLGYRYLSFDFQEDEYVADLEILGYALGFQFNW